MMRVNVNVNVQMYDEHMILVHACMMHVSKVIDPDTCVYHAGMYDEF